MALPSGITPKAITIGIASFFDGSIASGRVTISAPVNVIHTPTNRPIFSSDMTQQFVDGAATFNLCPTDAPGLNRIDWVYKAKIEVTGAAVQPEPVYFILPTAGPDTVDLDGLVTVPSSAGVPISVDVLSKADFAPSLLTELNNTASATSVALRAAFSPADVLDREQSVLMGVQSAEQRNLAAGTTMGGWSAADAASAITGAVNLDSVLDPFGTPSVNPIFRYLRGAPVVREPGVYPGQTVVKMAGLTADATELLPLVVFHHEGATKIEVRIFGRGSNETKLRVSVDGAWVSYTQLDGPANDGSLHRCLVTLPDTSKHAIGLEFGGFSAWFAGISVDPAAKITRDVRNLGARLIVVGDSETEGANGLPNSVGNKLGFAPELGRLLGLPDTWQSGLGDTGYIGTSAGTRATVGQRLQADVIGRSPDWVHFAGGQVDAGLGTPVTRSQMLTAVGDALDRTRAGLPNAQITVQSPWVGFLGLDKPQGVLVRDAIRDACKSRGVPFYDVSEFLTDVNSPTYMGVDGVHLSQAGHTAAARYIAAQIRRSVSRPGV